MGRIRLGAVGAICMVVAVGAATGVATADSSPSASAAQAFVAGSPTAIGCDKSVDATVTVTGTPGTRGQATDVEIVVDLSGSTNEPTTKFTDLKNAATDTLRALDAADGKTDGAIHGNAVGLISYSGSTATPVAPIGSSYDTVATAIDHLPTPANGSPHDVGINAGAMALAASGNPGKALVLISDGQAGGSALTAATNAAAAAKAAGVTIVPFGIGNEHGDPAAANLTVWATKTSFYQNATAAPIDQAKLTPDLGAAMVTPVAFTLTETLGSTFSAAPLSTSTGTATPSPGTLQWTGTLTGPSATMTYRATRNGSDVFSSTNEVVSTISSLVVTGGTASVTPPASLSIGVLPCGGTLVAATTCTGTLCAASGTSGGETFTVSAGNAPAGTSVVVAGLSTSPPAGVCRGFDASTDGIEFDISPFTRDATFQYTIPKAALGTRKWWQTEVCVGTNLKFTTAINSLANLRPGAKLVGGGTVPSRWWGLLPSFPRFTFIQGLGLVRGPYVSSRSVDRAGNATVRFVVPFVPGSTAYTTDGKPGYDPKRWGGG